MIELLNHYTDLNMDLDVENRIVILKKEDLDSDFEDMLNRYQKLSQNLSFEVDTTLLSEYLTKNIYSENLTLFISIKDKKDMQTIFSLKEKIAELDVTFEILTKDSIIQNIKSLIPLQKMINIPFYVLKQMDKDELNTLTKLIFVNPILFQSLFPFTGIVSNLIENKDNIEIDFWILSDIVLDKAFYIDKDGKVSINKNLASKGFYFSDSFNILKIKSSKSYKELKEYQEKLSNDCKNCSILNFCEGYLRFRDEKFDCTNIVDMINEIKDSLSLLAINDIHEQDKEAKKKKEIVTNIQKEPEFRQSKKAIFSLPFFTNTPEDFFYNTFLPFLDKYSDYLFDIYFTYNMPPFKNDAMSCARMVDETNESVEEQNRRILSTMLQIQAKYGIKVSATFNNIFVDPTEENLNLFIKNLKPLYEEGLRSVTIPHYNWMLNGKLRKEFPKLTIKNTILKKVSKPQEYVDYAKAGFDVINIDRYNLRDRDNLKRLKKAYDKYKVPMVILANEWCRGLCPAMSEHYQYNCSSSNSCSKLYFDTSLGHLTCPTWQTQEEWYNLKNANIPVFKKDIDELLNYIQVFKLHGRNDFGLMQQSINIIKNYAEDKEVVFNELYDFMMHYKYDKKSIQKWTNFTKNCKFECWDCHACEELHKSGEKNRVMSADMIF